MEASPSTLSYLLGGRSRERGTPPPRWGRCVLIGGRRSGARCRTLFAVGSAFVNAAKRAPLALRPQDGGSGFSEGSRTDTDPTVKAGGNALSSRMWTTGRLTVGNHCQVVYHRGTVFLLPVAFAGLSGAMARKPL